MMLLTTLAMFSELQLGKGVVLCADTPGFLANRVGVFAIQCAIHNAFDLGAVLPPRRMLFLAGL